MKECKTGSICQCTTFHFATTAAAPEFVVEESGGDTQHGIDSRPVKITLQLRGVPLPNVEWYFKDKKIMYGDRHEGYVTPTGRRRESMAILRAGSELECITFTVVAKTWQKTVSRPQC